MALEMHNDAQNANSMIVSSKMSKEAKEALENGNAFKGMKQMEMHNDAQNANSIIVRSKMSERNKCPKCQFYDSE